MLEFEWKLASRVKSYNYDTEIIVVESNNLTPK